MRLVACIQYAGQTAEREEHDHPNPASKPGSRNSAELTLRLRRSHVLYVTRCREMDDFAQTVGWPQGHATLHSMVASKRSDDALHDGDEMQLTSSGFSLSQVLSGERVRMRMIQHTRARAGRRVLSSTRGDEVCSLLDETGQPLGTILNPEGTPHVGPNEATVLLRRDN